MLKKPLFLMALLGCIVGDCLPAEQDANSGYKSDFTRLIEAFDGMQ